MKLGDILEFRKDLYFEGAVQIDWFYNQNRAAKVAENFVFHGKNYFGVEETTSGGKKRIDTVGLVQALTAKLGEESVKVPSLAIADYGTGKSHLAVTLGQLFSGPDYMPETYTKILTNIRGIDETAAKEIEQNCDGCNFVMVINGMRDFNLHSEILRAAQKSLALYGLPDDNLKKLNRALETAEMFFDRNSKKSIGIFETAAKEYGWSEKGECLEKKIKNELLSNEEAFEIVNKAYKEINGQEIRWDEGLSASAILEMLVTEYCGMNGKFDHIILLFDEFGRYLEYASGVSAAKSGDSALQQIFEVIQNSDGVLQVINFIQSDIKTYLQRIDQTKNISRYIGRYDGSDKYYISSNLETVFANLIQRKDKEAFNNTVVNWQNENELVWKDEFKQLNKWLLTKGMWKDYNLFRKVVVEGIYPMHPLATFMLTQLSDYLQNRSSLTLISQYIEELSDKEMIEKPILIMPEYLMRGDLYTEMLAAEQDGKQPSQQCIRYDNILRKFGDKLSEKSLIVLRANLILRILRFRTTDYNDAKSALVFASGLPLTEIEEELHWLENEYAVLGFDEHAGCFDFMEESNGAHDFKVIKKRLIAAAKVNRTYINSFKIQEIAGVTDIQTTNFGTLHKIATNEWQFKQELYPIEEFTEAKADAYVEEWRSATSSIAAKGRLIWLYLNKDCDSEILGKVQLFTKKFENTFIVVDAGEVVGKYKRLFIKIQDNRIMSNVNVLEKELEQMTMADEVPEEIETEYILAKNILNKGIIARKNWQAAVSAVEEYYDEAIVNGDLYNALKGLEALEALPIDKHFMENGFDFDDESKKYLMELRSNIVSIIDDNIDVYVANMYCKDVEHLTSFRNHNQKMQKLLTDLGFSEYARRVEKQKEKELDNIAEIKSRQELRKDYSKFITESKIDRFTSYVAVKESLKQGKLIQERVNKFRISLGKDGENIQNTLNTRIKELETFKNRIEQDITDIWDDLPEVKNSDDIEDLIERITIVLQKGISSGDQGSLEEIKNNLVELLADVEKLNATDSSRNEFEIVSTALQEKYKESEFDFEVNDILSEVIVGVSKKLDEKEDHWKKVNLTLGNKKRENVHRWKENIKFLPEYLSEKTRQEIKVIDIEADEIIKEGKIEDVVFYFDKLDREEKLECLKKLEELV